MALPTFQGQGAGSATASIASLDVAYPGSLVRNDYIILHVTVRNTTTTVTTPTAGGTWDVIQTAIGAGSTTTGRHWVFGHKCDGTESGNLTVAFGSDAAVCKTARMYYFRNVDVVTPYEGGSTSKATGTTVSATSLTTSGTDRLGLHFLYVTDDNAVASFTGESGGDWTEAVAEYTTTLGSDTCIQLQTAGLASATTISGGTLTMVATDPYGCATVALRNGTDQRYVWDNIGAAEAVTVAMSWAVNLYDDVGLNENIAIAMSWAIDVYDNIGVTDEETLDIPVPPLEINLYDGISLEDTENILYPITVIIGETITVLMDVVPIPFEGVEIGESVAVNKDIIPSVSEGIATGEIVSILKDVVPVPFEGVAIGETATVALSWAINLSDNVGIAETATVVESAAGDLSVNLYDGIGTSDILVLLKDLNPLVFDGIAAGEAASVQTDRIPYAYEGIAVGETATIVKDSPSLPSVFDGVAIGESTVVLKDVNPSVSDGVAVGETIAINKDIVPSVYDGIAIGETVTVSIASANQINVYEGIGITDVENILYPITIVVGETVTISWITYPGFLYNYERIGVSESVEVSSGGIGINVYDNIGIHEANYYIPQVEEIVGVSDINTVFLSWLNLNIYETIKVHDSTFPLGDQVTVTEVVTVSMDVSTVMYPFVSDTIAVSEYIDIEGPQLQIQAVENIGFRDVPEFTLNLGDINLFDSVGLTDFAEAGIVEASYLAVNVHDNAGTQENLDRAETIGDILKTETIGIRDFATVLKNLYAEVAKSIGIEEYLAVVQDVVSPLLLVNNADPIGVSESVSVLTSILIAAIEGVGVRDVPEMAQDILVSAYDVIGIAESMELLFSTYLSRDDAIGLREYIDLLIDVNVSSVQGVGIREYHDVEMEIPGLASIDRSFIGEYIAVRMQLATGRVNVTFDYRKPNISMSQKKPDITFDHKQPVIAFAGE